MTTPMSKQRLQDLYDWLRQFRDLHSSTVGVYHSSRLSWKYFDDAMSVVLEKLECMEDRADYFVWGVVDDGGECTRVDDADAQFWTIYRLNADGTSDALADLHSRERAEELLKALVSTAASQPPVPDCPLPKCLEKITADGRLIRLLPDLFELRTDGDFYDFSDDPSRALAHEDKQGGSFVEYVALTKVQDFLTAPALNEGGAI